VTVARPPERPNQRPRSTTSCDLITCPRQLHQASYATYAWAEHTGRVRAPPASGGHRAASPKRLRAQRASRSRRACVSAARRDRLAEASHAERCVVRALIPRSRRPRYRVPVWVDREFNACLESSSQTHDRSRIDELNAPCWQHRPSLVRVRSLLRGRIQVDRGSEYVYPVIT
jgi:hypothetical protein